MIPERDKFARHWNGMLENEDLERTEIFEGED